MKTISLLSLSLCLALGFFSGCSPYEESQNQAVEQSRNELKAFLDGSTNQWPAAARAGASAGAHYYGGALTLKTDMLKIEVSELVAHAYGFTSLDGESDPSKLLATGDIFIAISQTIQQDTTIDALDSRWRLLEIGGLIRKLACQLNAHHERALEACSMIYGVAAILHGNQFTGISIHRRSRIFEGPMSILSVYAEISLSVYEQAMKDYGGTTPKDYLELKRAAEATLGLTEHRATQIAAFSAFAQNSLLGVASRAPGALDLISKVEALDDGDENLGIALSELESLLVTLEQEQAKLELASYSRFESDSEVVSKCSGHLTPATAALPAPAANMTTLLELTGYLQQTKLNFSEQYLQLKQRLHDENMQFSEIASALNTKHDAVKNAINNVR